MERIKIRYRIASSWTNTQVAGQSVIVKVGTAVHFNLENWRLVCNYPLWDILSQWLANYLKALAYLKDLRKIGGVQVNIRMAKDNDIDFILANDEHISKNELCSCFSLGRVLVAECDDKLIGCLRWNLFWDNTPFFNMLFLVTDYQNKGYGKSLMRFWENFMKENNYKLVMTSTLSSESA